MPKSPPSRAKSVSAEKIAALASPPSWIEPCVPTLVEKPPVRPHWRHEVKWDGYRVSIVIDAGKATVRTRRGLDWTVRFKGIAAAASELPCHSAIIDGEAVVLDKAGHSDYAALIARLGGETRAEVILYAFDPLFLDGRDLRPLPLRERREALVGLIGRPTTGAILLSDGFDIEGAKFFRLVSERGLEGMVSKRVDLPYRSGRSKDWLKVKCVQTDYFAIIGYEPRGSTGIANLKLAANDNGVLRYAGAVGTGFTAVVEQSIKKANRSPLIDSIFALDVRPYLCKDSGMTDFSLENDDQLAVLNRIDPARNMARYYVLSLEPALFDQFSLVRK
jgi:bifunctional non-homologous end joining protein LigD